MSRIRSIKPEILEDEKTSSLSHLEWRLFVSLWLLADDYGNLRGEPGYIQGVTLWASREPRETVAEALKNLARLSLMSPYSVRGQRYIHISGWTKHQRVDKPGKPHCPGPDQADSVSNQHVADDSRESRESLAESSRNPRESLAPDPDQDPDQDHELPKPAKPAPAPVVGYSEVIEAFDSAYKAQTGSKPTWGKKQGAQVKSLLASHSALEVCRRIETLFQRPPAWLQPPFDLGTLVQHFDKLAAPTAHSGASGDKPRFKPPVFLNDDGTVRTW